MGLRCYLREVIYHFLTVTDVKIQVNMSAVN